jgi:uncharacterized protein YbbK (DUF523 family)
MRPIKVGISACLLGDEVRYDGGHKRDTFLADTLGRFVEWVPVCPEVECGLGTPREAMRLVRVGNDVRMITVKTETDLTARMETFARRRLPKLVLEGLSGYVFKKDSPSCGLERVKVYDGGAPTRSGRGLFAAAWSIACRTCRSKKRGGCPMPGCGTTSSSVSSPTGGCAPCSTARGRLVRSSGSTPRTNWS